MKHTLSVLAFMLALVSSAWAACTPEDAAYCQNWSLKYGSLPCPLACTVSTPPPTVLVCQPLDPGYCAKYGVSPCQVCTQVAAPPPAPAPTPPPPVK